MEKEVRHYVEQYFYFGYLDKGDLEIDSREEYLKSFGFDTVDTFVGLRFYDREVIRSKGYIILGDPFNYSPFIKYMKSIDDAGFLAKHKEFGSIVSFDDYKREVLGESKIIN